MNRVYLFQQVDSIIDDIVRDRVREALAKEYRMDSKDESEFWDLVHDYINAPTIAAERLIAWVDAKIERREPARAGGKTKDPEGIISIQIRTDHFLLADFFIDILRRGDITICL